VTVYNQASALAGFKKAINQKAFRGEIYDYARTIKLGSGYILPQTNVCRNCQAKGIAHCRHFEIDTCRQVMWAFKALNDTNVDRVMLIKAVQTLGSLVWDLTLHFLIIHSPYCRIKVFIDSIEKTDRYCDDRLMPTLKGNPEIARLIPTGLQRFDATKTGINFLNGKTIEILALNENNASSLSADFVVIDEAWLHGSDGLLQKAIDRTKQAVASGNCKVFIVGQAGNKDEDQDKQWMSLNVRVRAKWKCPRCNGEQSFGERAPGFIRPDDFKPICFEGVVPPLPGTYAGLKIHRRPSELHTPSEIKKACANAFLECLWCGFEIQDAPEMRRKILETYDQDYRLTSGDGTKYTPEHFSVGFWNPDPASETIPFSETMREYIAAKKADEDFKLKIPLRDFYQNRWATAWDENLIKVIRARMQEKYDAQTDWPEEWKGRRSLIVDCQYELQHFWGSVWSVSQTGKSRQLWRGLMRTFGDAKTVSKWTPSLNETPTVTEVQKHFGALDQRVFLDAGYMRNELVDECAKHGHWGKFDGERAWYCWTLLVGSPQKDFQHIEEKNPKLRFPVSDPVYESPTFKVDNQRVEIETFYFSKLQMSQMAARYRDGNGPETLFLPETDNQENQLSWTAQIYACAPHYEPSKKTGESSEIWKSDKQSTPHHYWDVLTMFCAVLCLWDIGGYRQFTEPPEVEAVKQSAP
jgi:hypothetical protein